MRNERGIANTVSTDGEEEEEKKRKEKGKKGFEKRARQPLTRFIYLYVLHTIPRGGGLAESRVQICLSERQRGGC